MKTKIVVGGLLAVCMLIMLPSIPAVEFNTVLEVNQSKPIRGSETIDFESLNFEEFMQRLKNIPNEEIRQKIKQIDFKELREKLYDSPRPPLYYLLVFLVTCLVGGIISVIYESYPVAGWILSLAFFISSIIFVLFTIVSQLLDLWSPA